MTANKDSPTNGQESSHRHVQAASTGSQYPLVDVDFRLYPNRQQGQIHFTIGLTQEEAEAVYRENFEVHRQTGPNSGITEEIDGFDYPENLREQLLQVLGYSGAPANQNHRNNPSEGEFEGISPK